MTKLFAFLLCALLAAQASAQLVSAAGHPIVSAAGNPLTLNGGMGMSYYNFTWTPPAYTTGEVTGYQIGLRTSGSPGTYSILLPLAGPTEANVIKAQILPALSTGTYHAAIQSLGPTPSAWSSEVTFSVP